MRTLLCVLVLLTIALGAASGQWQQGPPTEREISDAYRSKTGEHATIVPGVRWETWAIRNIRGWSLKYKRLAQERQAGMITMKYRIIANQSGTCAEYRVIDRHVFGPNPQMKSALTVEPQGVRACH